MNVFRSCGFFVGAALRRLAPRWPPGVQQTPHVVWVALRAATRAAPTHNTRALCRLRGPYGLPHAVRRCRHVDVMHAKRSKGIDYGVDGRGRCADRPGFARALDADRIGPAQHLVEPDIERRHAVGARHAIVHETAREQLAVLVIDDLFGEGLANALCSPPWTWPCTI